MKIIKTIYNTGGLSKHPEKLNGILLTNYHAQPEGSGAGKNKSGGNVLTFTTTDLKPRKRLSAGLVIECTQYSAIIGAVKAKSLQFDLPIHLMDGRGPKGQGQPSNIPSLRALLQPEQLFI